MHIPCFSLPRARTHSDQLERIFLPFTQEEQSTSRQFGGTGLGLTVRVFGCVSARIRSQSSHLTCGIVRPAPQICRRIASAMGGQLTAASEGRGRGMTLTFIVPLSVPPHGDGHAADGDDNVPAAPLPVTEAVADAVPRAVEATEPAAPTPAAARPASSLASSSSASGGTATVPDNILVAEDDPLSQVVMRKVLQRLQLRFLIVGNGAAAVEAYKAGAHARGLTCRRVHADWRVLRAACRRVQPRAHGPAQCVVSRIHCVPWHRAIA
jgi:hypothetical protein